MKRSQFLRLGLFGITASVLASQRALSTLAVTVPTVVDISNSHDRTSEINQRLLRERVVFLGQTVNDDVANSIIAQMLYLDSEDPEQDIYFYINSPGGSVTAGLAIFETMNQIRPEVITICVGLAASMGAFLLSAGTKGKRLSLPDSRIMIHQPSLGSQSQEVDSELQSREIQRITHLLNQYLAEHTGQSIEQIEKDTKRDFFMSAQEALEYGLIDIIVEKNTPALHQG